MISEAIAAILKSGAKRVRIEIGNQWIGKDENGFYLQSKDRVGVKHNESEQLVQAFVKACRLESFDLADLNKLRQEVNSILAIKNLDREEYNGKANKLILQFFDDLASGHLDPQQGVLVADILKEIAS